MAILADETKVPKVMELILQEKANLVSLVPQKESLEEIFMREVKETHG